MKREVKVTTFDKALGLVQRHEALYSKKAGCEVKSLFGARIFFDPATGNIIDPIEKWTRKRGPKSEAQSKEQQVAGRKVWEKTHHPNLFEKPTALYDAIGRYGNHIRPYYEGKRGEEDGKGEREELFDLARDIRELRTLLAILPQASEKTREEIQTRARELAEQLASDVFTAPLHAISVEKLEAWEQLVQIVPLVDSLGRSNPSVFQVRATTALDRIDKRRLENTPAIQTHLAAREKALLLEEAVSVDTLREAVEATVALGKGMKQTIQFKEGMAMRVRLLQISINRNWRCKPFIFFTKLLTPTLNQLATSLNGGYRRSAQNAHTSLINQLKGCCAAVGLLRQQRGLPILRMLRSAMQQVSLEQLPIAVEVNDESE